MWQKKVQTSVRSTLNRNSEGTWEVPQQANQVCFQQVWATTVIGDSRPQANSSEPFLQMNDPAKKLE